MNRIFQGLREIIFGKAFFVPKNLNFWYVFGSLLLFALVIQFVSGLWLAMFYQPSAAGAYASIQYIVREVPFGWLLREVHSIGASALFILLYLHLMRGLLYRSYRAPRGLVWFFGVCLFWFMMAEAFFGYLLPWGQMSYWGATVITNLFSIFPHGDQFVAWLRGDYQVSGVTLTRFYALHIVALPVILIFLIQWHVKALHLVGSGNPELLPIDTRGETCPKDCQPFFPFQFFRDFIAVIIFLILFVIAIFFAPHFFHEPLNLVPADPMQTPADIKPLWYLSSFYSLLRAVPSKWAGIALLFFSMFMWLLMPLFDRMAQRRGVHRAHKILVALWFLVWAFLSYVGLEPVSFIAANWVLGFSVAYFVLFILMGVL